MTKGYWVVNNIVHDLEKYEDYKKLVAAAFEIYGGRFIVRGGQQQDREGLNHPRSIVVEFPSYTAAIACYDSSEYNDALQLRLGIADGSLIIVEGYDG